VVVSFDVIFQVEVAAGVRVGESIESVLKKGYDVVAVCSLFYFFW
jgi:phosphoribosylformimino-5-aminoimidazole carboxamide ribonucleotide (ProFAR) isomerase